MAQCLKLITKPGSIRIVKYDFKITRLHKRKKIEAVHKANIQKITDGLFLKCFYEVAEYYPYITASDIIVDNAAMN